MIGVQYLTVTGDSQLLSEKLPFYPNTDSTLPPNITGTTVLDHLRAAYYHLQNVIGKGPHGLLRIQGTLPPLWMREPRTCILTTLARG